MWSPASTVWTDRVAAAASPSLVGEPESFTHTPVVFGVPETMARALGYPDSEIGISDFERLCQDPEGWGSVGKSLWGSFKISKTNPNTSTTGLSAILMQSYEASGKTADLTAEDVAAAADFSRVFEECVIHYGDTTGKVLATLYDETQNGAGGSGYVSAVALEETSLLNYNQGNPDSHTVQPGETLTAAQGEARRGLPFGRLDVVRQPRHGARRAVGDRRAARSRRGVRRVPADRGGAADPARVRVPSARRLRAARQAVHRRVRSRPGGTRRHPAQADGRGGLGGDRPVDADPQALVGPRGHRHLGLDGRPIGDGRSKLDGAIEGAQATLGHFRSTDEVGVWAFTTGVESAAGENLVVLRDVSPLASDRESVGSSLADLRFAQRNGTPLYDAIAAAYDEMTARAEPGRINAIVVLSDGQDTDSSISLDSLVAKIGKSSREGGDDAPVRIFPIAYGEGADTNSLQRIAEATGGQWFDASDAAKIDLVFASVINNF